MAKVIKLHKRINETNIMKTWLKKKLEIDVYSKYPLLLLGKSLL